MNQTIRTRGELFSLSRPLVMGILNLTPDSFYAASRATSLEEAMVKVDGMLQEGADIIDLGGYSTRPGAADISPDEELSRVLPVIRMVRERFPHILISIDTFRASVAKDAMQAGADMVNDVSGGDLDPEMFPLIAEHNYPYILMHMRGTPQTMQSFTEYEDIVHDIRLHLTEKVNYLRSKGVSDLIIDPGIGFSKTAEQNFEILRRLEELTCLDIPVLIGISRKSFLYKTLNKTPEEILPETTAMTWHCLQKGASIIRTHDVASVRNLILLRDQFN